MKWEKKGFIYNSNAKYDWNQSHAQLPVVDLIENERFRIYFSTRDKENRSNSSYIEVDANDPQNILYEHNEPVLELGKLGTFDDCGTMPSWILTLKEKKYLYYIGWNVRNTISYHNCVGLAISDDGGKSFNKFSDGPLWDRNYIEPQYSGTSCVMIDNGIWKNWYLSCTEWRMVNGKPEPRYHIKYAESNDGIHWIREGKVAIDYKDSNEAGIVKASVLKDGRFFKMWYSFRNFDGYRENIQNSYRIGYAESINGIDWTRKDHKAGIDVSSTGWDSLMIEYPHVIDYKDKRLMFYNGNGFGKSGFGYAELLKD